MTVGRQMVRRLATSLALSAAVWLAGCAHSSSGSARRGGPTGVARARVQGEDANPRALSSQLMALASIVRQEEAERVAFCAYDYSRQLAREYRAVRPAALQNILVHLRLRRRGLCYQWAEDLLAELQTLNLLTLELRWGMARAGTHREHNCVVVTARGQAFENGIVLDAWRRSGRLVWASVSADTYPWVEGELTPTP